MMPSHDSKIQSSKIKSGISTLLIFILGICLGILSKYLDSKPINELWFWLQTLDLGNFFSRMGVWLFLAVVIAKYSETPIKAALNIFLFFVSMVGAYYWYTVTFEGFNPKAYMMIWGGFSLVSPVLAYVTWHVRGKGWFSELIAIMILVFLSRQTFAFGFWYFDLMFLLELILYLIMIGILYKSPKQIVRVVGLSVIIFLLTAQINIFWGLL